MISSVLDSGDSNLIDDNFVGIVILMQDWVSNISDKELLF